MDTENGEKDGRSPIGTFGNESTPCNQELFTISENVNPLDLNDVVELRPNVKHDLYEECREAMEESADPDDEINGADIDDYSEPIIDKNEMVEASDDQDILGSPHSSFSFEDACDQEIDGLTNFNIILEYPELNLEKTQILSFTEEINDWFCARDLQQLKSVAQISKNIGTSSLESIFKNLNHLLNNIEVVHNVDGKILENIIHLTYIAMGCFNHSKSEMELSEKMKLNCKNILKIDGLIELLIDIIKFTSLKLSDANNLHLQVNVKKVKSLSSLLFYSMTVLFIIVVSFNTSEDYEDKQKLNETIDEKKLLVCLLEGINKWRWILNATEVKDPALILESMGSKVPDFDKFHHLIITSFRIRNVIMLLNQLIIFQFGNLQHLKSTKDFLKFKFEKTEVTNEDCKSTDYSISPLDYEYYVNELSSRYPTYTPPKYEITEIQEILASNDNTNKYSDLINVESLLINQHQHLKSKKDNLTNMVNDPPEIHIATPMPSPTLTPQHTGNTRNFSSISEFEHGSNEIKKKLYITQSNFPNVYPSSETAPKSIQEAADILFHHIRESVSDQQFTSVFEDFIKVERGMKEFNGDVNERFKYGEKDSLENPMFQDEIRSLQYVEKFYEEGLPYFNSLIYVLLQMLVSNIIPSQQSSDGKSRQRTPSNSKLNQDNKPYISSKLTEFEKQKLEIIKLKETLLKSSSSIILMLQKWFKVSHILKFEFFTTLLFDQEYLIYLFRYLDSNKIQTYAGKNVDIKDPDNLLNNRIVYCDYQVLYHLEDYNFFIKCLKISRNPIKEISQMSEAEEIEEFNSIFDKNNEDDENDIDNNNHNNSKINPLSFILPFVPHEKIVKVNNPNKRCCISISNLLQSMYYIISHFKIQRIYKLIGVRPSEILRFYLTLHNKIFYKPILKTIKLMSPFIGKKWRANNMDLISYVYLFYKIELKDPWLNNFFNAGIEENTKRGFDNEVSLRSLIKFYNFKNYKESIERHGYKIDCIEFLNEVERIKGDFFTKECEEIE
ncbi:hypothetical protein CANINC_002514 [Pichia inconspicua]|uniref:Factor arrest protein 11 n=1 Tax=Pichia inconspicua TaxID=52247 RepID=A0A4T0X0X4_9ASCO|nr:hypothetical protein CANINC_002514 [[Candida] inconspicua]